MKAMILAAGRGARMKPITDHTPKPLLPVAGKPLIVHHLLALAQAGIHEVVINVSHLADQIQTALGDGMDYGVHITYSVEPEALETGGGIYQVLPILGDEPFIVISGDIWTDYPLHQLPRNLNNNLAHLVLVDNPSYHPKGDYALHAGKLSLAKNPKLTYASFGVLHPKLFHNSKPEIFRLTNVLNPAIAADKVSGEHFQGDWVNVGTTTDLQELTDRVGATCRSPC